MIPRYRLNPKAGTGLQFSIKYPIAIRPARELGHYSPGNTVTAKRLSVSSFYFQVSGFKVSQLFSGNMKLET